MTDSLLVAIGGNATHPDNIRGTQEEQERVADRAARALLPLVRKENRLLITHGNGPVVGKILMRMMLTRDADPADAPRRLRGAQPGRHRLHPDAGAGERDAPRRRSSARRPAS